jgi:hypothetical protein
MVVVIVLVVIGLLLVFGVTVHGRAGVARRLRVPGRVALPGGRVTAATVRVAGRDSRVVPRALRVHV